MFKNLEGGHSAKPCYRSLGFLVGKGSTGQGTEELSRNEIEESEESCPRGQMWQCRMGWDSVETQWGFGKNSLQWAHVGIKA